MRKPATLQLATLLVSLTIICVSCTPEPIAGFMANKTTVKEGETVQFSDLTTNEPTVWAWEFPGGTPSFSNEQNPQVVYSEEGTYSVSLEARNKGGSNTMIRTDYITVEAATTDVNFINNTYTPIEITLGGISRTVPIGGQTTYTDLEGNSVEYFAYTYETTASENQIGLELQWDYSVDLTTDDVIDYDLNIGTSYFFLYITNNGTRTIGPIEVYHGDPDPLVANVGLPNDGVKYKLGYYRARTDTEVRAYYYDEPESYVYWENLVYPDEQNQSVSLSNSFKKGTGSAPGRIQPAEEPESALRDNGYIPSKGTREGAIGHVPNGK